jgi:amino acid adenylation domain-containing protein
LPFEKLVDELEPARDLARSPLFQVMFTLQQAAGAVLQMEQLRLSTIDVESTTVKFDLSLSLAAAGEQLGGTLDYSTDLFARASVDRMLEHWQMLLAAVVEHPGRAVTSLPLLTAVERDELQQWERTLPDYEIEHYVPELFTQQASRTSAAVALVCAGEELTYGELEARANQLAHFLRRSGVGPEVRVGVMCPRSVALVVALLGTLKAGGAYLPLDPDYPGERLALMLEDAQASVLLTVRALAHLVPHGYAERVVYLDAEWEQIAGQSEQALASVVQAETLAYLIYTSGSTGRPKAVMVQHGNLANVLQASQQRFGFGDADVMPCLASFAFDISLFELLTSLLAGGQVLLLTREEVLDMAALTKALRQVTLLHAVPTLMRQIVEHIAGQGTETLYAGIRQVFVGGDAVPSELLAAMLRVFGEAEIQVLYGPTEATIICTSQRVREELTVSGRVIGRALPGMSVGVYDAQGQAVPVGVRGELWVSGAGVTRGYWQHETETRSKYVERDGERYYRTGDLGRWLAGGVIEFLGRFDEQVKVRGYRIELGEVEAVLRQHPRVSDAVVIVREQEESAKQLVAYVVGAESSGPQLSQELRGYLKEQLPHYMIPAVFVVLEELPLTSTGKLNRRALPAPDAAAPAVGTTPTFPRNEVEAQLAEIWREVLRLQQVSVHDNFFERGGDSILSIQIIARANQAGLRLTPKDLFQHQTIAELAVVAVQARVTPAAVEAEVPRGPLPLLPIQKHFFEQQLTNPTHFNQAVLLASERRLEWRFMETSLARLLREHDALRLRFSYDTERGEWQQQYAAADGSLPLMMVDLSALPTGAEQARALAETSTQMQASLDIETGPLLRL